MTNKAVIAAISDPNTTAAPNRWVEGNSENVKMPKPKTITKVKVSTGCQKRCLILDQASVSLMFLYSCRLNALTM
ncbi:MAG: hypothetical protein HQL12_01310 [Candidatus Omnitrophica bacterium]|nr:hypothetical protein [Candidatus Omnitrophota bacterium]